MIRRARLKTLNRLHLIRKDQDGATLVEFALVSPVMLFMMMGVFDVGYGVYMRSVLDGAIQKAGRDASLESGPSSLTAIDTRLRNTIRAVNKAATVTTARESYFQFSDVDRAEVFTDTNNNGVCDNGEPYGDENANSEWDDDIGASGIGDPRDVVQYTVTVSYDSLFNFGGYSRTSTGKKIVGYETKTRPKYELTPGEIKDIRVPVYELTRVPTSNKGNGFARVPIYQYVPTHFKTFKAPIYEFTEVPRKSGGTGLRRMPIYEFRVTTRNTGHNVAQYEDVQVPVYRNIITQSPTGSKLRRVLDHYETTRRVQLDTITARNTGQKQIVVRQLVGYQTVSSPNMILQRKLIGFSDVKTVAMFKRQLVGYAIAPKPTTTLKRTLVGYKTISKQFPGTKVAVGTETYKVPKYESADSGFSLGSIAGPRVMTATTVLQNQPYGNRNTAATVATRNCT